MKKALITLPLLLIGCQAPILKVNVPNLSISSDVILNDIRPESEKQNELFSYSIFSDAYGIGRSSGKELDPMPVRLFQHRIYEKIKKDGQPLQITINHFVIYSNIKSQLRKTSLIGVFAVPSVVSNNLKGATSASLVDKNKFDELQGDNEYKRAIYTESENPTNVSVIVTYIDAEVNGKRAFIRVMTPTMLPNKEGEAPINALVNGIEKATEYFITQIAG